MLRAIPYLAALPLLAATAFGQTQTYSVLRQSNAQLQHAAYQQPSDQILGNPFADDGPPAPIVHAAPASSGIVQATCAAEPTCGAPACDASCGVPTCGMEAPSCGMAAGCDSSCGGCGSCFECNIGDAWTLSGVLHGDCPPSINIGGWFQFGYHSEDNGMFNSRPDNLALHQGWLYAEKAADACSSPLGFRIDLMYGIDAGETQAFGNPAGSWDFDNGFDHGAYGWAIPQLYLEYAVGDWTLKAGHFYTLIGYEVVTAPDNFFYSHAMTMFFSEPFTHTGVLATRNVGDATIYAGWTLGWDTGFDQLNNGSSWLGGFSTPLGEDISFTYISTAGNFGWRGDSAYSHSCCSTPR